MKIFKYITNGVLLIIIGVMHTQFACSAGGFKEQIHDFSDSYFYKVSEGMNEFPATVGHTDFESFAALWFLLFGVFLIPLGLLVHSIEKQKLALPPYFTWTYLLVVLIGVYMVPNSGITFFMLPQAIYMLIRNLIRSQAIRVEKLDPVSLNQ